ncbi:MAG TPA: RNA methyltransferase [Actinomycetota bacterium]|jgi:TrmH family RNA methyltransferase|nr:RNA methyltransferase [Actinomycetota bacterium]
MDVITSPSNPAVRAARRLARPSARARADGRFLLEGPEGIRAALDAGHVPERLLATERAAARHAGLVNLARQRGAQVTLVAEPVLSALAATTTPQGLVAVVPSVLRSLDDLPAAPGLVCVLAEVRDPGNAGTVLRAADAFGADAVVTTRGSVDLQSPKAARAAAGSLFHLPVVAGAPWPELAAALRGRGLRLVGADPHADATVDRAPLGEPVALVLGNEAHGLPAEIAAGLDLVVRVPLAGRAESLNLAAAAAVLLYETARQQRRLPVSREEASVGR